MIVLQSTTEMIFLNVRENDQLQHLAGQCIRFAKKRQENRHIDGKKKKKKTKGKFFRDVSSKTNQ